MSALSFCFESTQVRTLGDSFNPLFVALDICKALGFTNPRKAVADHVDPEDLSKEEITDSLNRKQLVNCVNESGMYALIFGSKLPSAKRFKKWVTSEVLPSIRKNGSYSVNQPQTVTPAQQLLIRQCVAERARNDSKGYRDIYRAIHNRFQIARYDQLPQTELNECLKFIQEVDVICLPRDVLMLTPREAECISQFVYYWRYLFKPELQMILNMLRIVDSPKAARFSEMLTNMNLLLLERLLDEQGFPVYYNKELLED